MTCPVSRYARFVGVPELSRFFGIVVAMPLTPIRPLE